MFNRACYLQLNCYPKFISNSVNFFLLGRYGKAKNVDVLLS